MAKKQKAFKGDAYQVIKRVGMVQTRGKSKYPKQQNGLFLRSGVEVKRNGKLIQRFRFDELKRILLTNERNRLYKLWELSKAKLVEPMTEAEERKMNMLSNMIDEFEPYETFNDLVTAIKERVKNYARPHEVTVETYGSRYMSFDEIIDSITQFLDSAGYHMNPKQVESELMDMIEDGTILQSGKNLEYKETSIVGSNPHNKMKTVDSMTIDYKNKTVKRTSKEIEEDFDALTQYDFDWREQKRMNVVNTGYTPKPKVHGGVLEFIDGIIEENPNYRRRMTQILRQIKKFARCNHETAKDLFNKQLRVRALS